MEGVGGVVVVYVLWWVEGVVFSLVWLSLVEWNISFCSSLFVFLNCGFC